MILFTEGLVLGTYRISGNIESSRTYRQLAMDTGKYYEDESFPEYISASFY